MDRRWILHAVNVGYGDAFVWQREGEHCAQLLLDTGSGRAEEYEGEPNRIPLESYLDTQKLDRISNLVLSHFHEDHVGRIGELIETTRIDTLWLPVEAELFLRWSPNWERVLQLPLPGSCSLFAQGLQTFTSALHILMQRGVQVCSLQRGQQVEMDGIRLRVLGPEMPALEQFQTLWKRFVQLSWDEAEDPRELLQELDRISNSTSLLLLIEIGDWKGLFAADLIPQNWALSEEEFLLLQNVSVFKMPHHAQKDAWFEPVLSRILPAYTCVTASSDRRYNSAQPGIWQNWNQLATLRGKTIRHLWPDRPNACVHSYNPPGPAIQLILEGRDGSLRDNETEQPRTK